MVGLSNVSTVCFLRTGQWTLNILYCLADLRASLLSVTYSLRISDFTPALFRCWYLLNVSDICWCLQIVASRLVKDIPSNLVVLFIRHLCFPVGLHVHVSVTSVFAWIHIHKLLNQTIKYCSNFVLFLLIVAGKKTLFCTSQILWWVVCSRSVSWMLSVDVSIAAFLTLHVSSAFWQIEIFAKSFFFSKAT